MFKFYVLFNIICLYLAIKSVLSLDVPDSTEQKLSSLLSHEAGVNLGLEDSRREDDDSMSKRSAVMWFGPRLGKRTGAGELSEEQLEDLDGSPYGGEVVSKMATDIHGKPYVVLLLAPNPHKPQPLFYHTTTPRLGRRDSAGDSHQRPPFAPRLGRNLPFSPRLGRSFMAEPVPY